jgi:hypothetical protein
VRGGWALGLVSGLLLGCGGGVIWDDDPSQLRFRNEGVGYSIGHPGGDDRSEWRKVEIDGADLAFRRADGAALSLSSDCRKTSAPIGVLARHLIIGTERDDLLAASPVELLGDQGFSQTFDTREGGVTLRIKAVTLASGRCVFDFVAVGRDAGSFDQLERVFDDWWTSFERSPTAGQAEEASVARIGTP